MIETLYSSLVPVSADFASTELLLDLCQLVSLSLTLGVKRQQQEEGEKDHPAEKKDYPHSLLGK